MVLPDDIRGRGAVNNPRNRFEKLEISQELDDVLAEEAVNPRTQFIPDFSKSVLTTNDSPDVGFRYSVNPYRGCEHGCSYCYARPYHEYAGMSAGLDFESKILVKHDAAALLRMALEKASYDPDIIAMSGVTDCYQPAEKRFQLTRQCLEVLAEFRNPVGLITKNRLVTRDIDILAEMAAWNGAVVMLSITTLDVELSGRLEPGASRPQARLDAISKLADAGIPTGVNAAPMIPGLTDHELPAIIKAAADAGAGYAGYTLVRLPGAVHGIFEDWLARHYPGSVTKVMERIRDVHGGRVNSSQYRQRMKGAGEYAAQVRALFHSACRRAGLTTGFAALDTSQFRRPGTGQMDFFDL